MRFLFIDKVTGRPRRLVGETTLGGEVCTTPEMILKSTYGTRSAPVIAVPYDGDNSILRALKVEVLENGELVVTPVPPPPAPDLPPAQ